MVRVKRRYIAMKLKHQRGYPEQNAFIKELKENILKIYGDFGMARLNRGFTVKKYDPNDGVMILCVRKGAHEMVMSVAPLIVTVDKKPCDVTIFHLSGTIRSCLKLLKKDYITKMRETISVKQNKNLIHTSVETYIAK